MCCHWILNNPESFSSIDSIRVVDEICVARYVIKINMDKKFIFCPLGVMTDALRRELTSSACALRSNAHLILRLFQKNLKNKPPFSSVGIEELAM